MQRLEAGEVGRTGHGRWPATCRRFMWGRENASMQTSTHAGATAPLILPNARRPVSAARLDAILQIEYRTVRSANHPQCTISAPRWREPANPAEPNWTIEPPRECPDGCHLLIAMVAADLATRYRLERRARRRA